MENLSRLENGQLIAATPMDYQCEFGEAKNNGGCNSSDVKQYIRTENDCDGSDWDEEPIFLCEKHSTGHKLYNDNILKIAE